MVKEIECPYCHSKVLPKHRFSSAVFGALLALGVIPFILNVVGYAILWKALSPFLALLEMMPPPPGMPPGVIEAFKDMFTSLSILSVASVLLYLVMGVIPAVIYWAFRRGTHSCPTCEMTI